MTIKISPVNVRAAMITTYIDFLNLKKQATSSSQPDSNGQDPNGLQSNIDRLLDIYGQCQNLLADYDKKLVKVVEKHENDFLNAYKTHMSKVERELQQLKRKAAD
jgi:hypothetical protein